MLEQPFKGMSFLWRKSIARMVKIVQAEDDRLLGLVIDTGSYSVLILNVYLPYYSDDNYPSCLMYLGKIESVIAEQETDGVIVVGDFNADVDSLL